VKCGGETSEFRRTSLGLDLTDGVTESLLCELAGRPRPSPGDRLSCPWSVCFTRMESPWTASSHQNKSALECLKGLFMSTQPAPALPQTVYVVFSGQIDQTSVQRLINAATNVMQQGVKQVHLLFQSNGGFIGDGICLYNFLRAITTLDITIYNGGSVSSMGVIAFLAVKERRTSKHGTFMIHRSHRSMEHATAAKLEEAAASLRIDDARVEAILREHITLTPEQWEELNYNDLTFNADDSVKIGFAQAIAEFAPPPGANIFTV
jgi:ATP-dependent Clp protease, protease subunit